MVRLEASAPAACLKEQCLIQIKDERPDPRVNAWSPVVSDLARTSDMLQSTYGSKQEPDELREKEKRKMGPLATDPAAGLGTNPGPVEPKYGRVLYGLPCGRCGKYYSASLDACPICHCGERVSATAAHNQVVICPIPT
jgi:hypothetical protein